MDGAASQPRAKADRAHGLDPGWPELRLLGERLCLHFANTVEDRAGDHPQEFLHAYPDLVRWARHVGELDEAAADRLRAAAAARPAAADAVFARALALRDAVYRTFHALARGGEPAAPDLDLLAAEHGRAMARARLAPAAGADGYALTWPTDDGAEPGSGSGSGSDLDRPLWPVARSAVEVLTGGDPARLKECTDGGCGWLFYDMSKNGSRRWCSMEGCGSRAKMRRLYARRRARAGSGSAPPS